MTQQQRHTSTFGPQGPTFFHIQPAADAFDDATITSGRPPPKTGADFLKLAADALADLERDLAAGKSATLVEFLATMGNFHNYSFSNVMLIYLQRPNATQVAGFNTWKKLGRHVLKGEKGIGIIAPMVFGNKDDSNSTGEEVDATRIRFRVVHVFDVAQTDGKPLAEFSPIAGDPGKYLQRLREIVVERKITLTYEDIPGGAEGMSRGGAITIQAGLPPAKDFAVLAHELAHELLHKADRRAETTKTQRETEAEAVAFVVSRTIGLNCGTHASDYIQLYQGDIKTLSSSLSLIQGTASDILRQLVVPKVGSTEDAG